MKIEIENIKIKSLNQEALVDLISTATYDNGNFTIDYPVEYYKENLSNENDCWEDKIAKCLLAGQSIIVSDLYAEFEESHGDLPHEWDKIRGVMNYTVTLKDVIVGLEKAFESGEDYKMTAAFKFVTDDVSFDLNDADILFQTIVFGDYIYG